MINPEWLRYFLTLAETRNFHAAAEQLHITHQALSHAVARMEAHFGLKLLDRGQRIRGLTPAGEGFLEEIRGIVSSMENLERRMAELKDDTPRGPISLASVGFANTYFLPGVLGRLVTEHQAILPSLYTMAHDDIERWVEAGEIDVGVLLAPPVRSNLAWAAGERYRYVIAGKPQPVRAWDALGFIVPRSFMRPGLHSLDGWPEDEYPRRVAARVDNLDVALKLCEAGVGATFAPEIAIADRVERGTLAVVAEAPFQHHERFYLVWREKAHLTPAVREALRALGVVPPSR